MPSLCGPAEWTILLALQQVREGLQGLRGGAQVPVQNLFALHHLAVSESPETKPPCIIFKQVRALVTPYLH